MIFFLILFRFVVDLQTLAIFGKQTDIQTRPLLATVASQSTLPVIHVELELAPMDKKSDYRLFLVIEPLEIVYDAVSYNIEVNFFFFPLKDDDLLANYQSNCRMF